MKRKIETIVMFVIYAALFVFWCKAFGEDLDKEYNLRERAIAATEMSK